MSETGYTPGLPFQFPPIAAGIFPPFPNLNAAADVTAQVQPGPSIQIIEIAEPIASPANPVVPAPVGIETWAAVVPTYTLRRRPFLNEGGTFIPTYVSQIGGMALSWVPVYRGKPGLKPWLHMDNSHGELFTFPISQQIPVGLTTWAARYPDYVLKRKAWPNTGFAETWTPITITPPAPPTAHRKVDLRRRQMLQIRRLIR